MNRLLNICFAFLCLTFNSNIDAQVPNKAIDICPLLIGETLPNAKLIDAAGGTISLKDVIVAKPTVLVFYRGGWCPYCNMQLSGLVEIEKYILELGYQIVAISPDDFQNLKSTEEKDNINYKILSDPNSKFIQEIGIGFQTPTTVKGYIATKSHKGQTSDIMPVPTVLILDTDGVIKFEYINPNYKERISGEMLLAVLKNIKNN